MYQASRANQRFDPSAPLYPVSTQDMIDQISKERMKHMNTELEIMKKQLVHYKKLAK